MGQRGNRKLVCSECVEKAVGNEPGRYAFIVSRDDW